jgi:peptidoglycan/xylan/chitin deacetylase (PgdA/CDA1 family)
MRALGWVLVLGELAGSGCSSHEATVTEMAVTVDDLPAHGPLPAAATRSGIAQELIRTLQEHSVPEVYGFVNGKAVEQSLEGTAVVRLWTDAGFPLGNHTYSHVEANTVTAREFDDDVARNEPVLVRFSQGHDYHYLRFPSLGEGETREKQREILRNLDRRGYTVADPSLDFYDWAWNEPYARCVGGGDSAEIQKLEESYLDSAKSQLDWTRDASQRIFGRQIRQILLLHVGAFEARMLDRLLTSYERLGVRFVGLRRALDDEAYRRRDDLPSDELRFFQRHARLAQTQIPGEPGAPLEKLARSCR